MAEEPQRLRGEPNREPGPVVNQDYEAGGRANDYGIARGIFALFDWRKRRKAMQARQQ